MRIHLMGLLVLPLLAPGLSAQDRAPAPEPLGVPWPGPSVHPARPLYARMGGPGRAPTLCWMPGTPGRADVLIPGTPPTPPLGGLPGTPGTPDVVIPGTPPVPGYWYVCE